MEENLGFVGDPLFIGGPGLILLGEGGPSFETAIRGDAAGSVEALEG